MERDKAKRKRKKGSALILTGLLMMAAALFLLSYNLYDELRSERAVSQMVNRIDEYLPFSESGPASAAGLHPV